MKGIVGLLPWKEDTRKEDLGGGEKEMGIKCLGLWVCCLSLCRCFLQMLSTRGAKSMVHNGRNEHTETTHHAHVMRLLYIPKALITNHYHSSVAL